jgi:4-amino-4-deoxy-L-arabinose transferase-like glycosyltransferase
MSASLQPMRSFLCWLLIAIALVSTSYQTADPDSQLYIQISSQLAQHPLKSWCAPQWYGFWQREGLFVEHPPFLFWLGALGLRLGISAHTTLYLGNITAWMLSLYLLQSIALIWDKNAPVSLILSYWICTPAFFQYLIRANHEPWLACALLSIVYCFYKPSSNLQDISWKAFQYTLILLGAILLKGLSGGALLVVLFFMPFFKKTSYLEKMAILLAVIGVLFMLALFEVWYQQITHHSFWQAYGQNQVWYSIHYHPQNYAKLKNLLYYLLQPCWYIFLPSITFIWFLLNRHKIRIQSPQSYALGFWVLFIFIAGFSLANRKASRYLFPAYPLFSLSAAISSTHIPINSLLQRWQTSIRFVPWDSVLCIITLCKIGLWWILQH